MIEIHFDGGVGRSNRVLTNSLRLSEDRLATITDDVPTDVAYWDGRDQQWHRLDGEILQEVSITSPDPARELLLEMVKPNSDGVLTATRRHGRLVLPGCRLDQLAHLTFIDESREPETVAFYFPVGSWDTGNEGWPQRAQGDLLVSHGGLAGLASWNGDVGTRVRPSSLAERRV